VDLNIILFNNQIYGLTKGQYSPTSKFGAITKTSPYGTVENPFTPGQLVIGARGTFFARGLDVDLNIILFNNQIYGLTKGQYSPTSKFGAITKTSPYGTVENPFTPGQLVIGARGTFFARGLDVEMKTNQEIFLAAALHKGASVCEMLVNCMIFNDGAHAAISAREVRADKTITLRDGEKMIFGANNDKGIVLENGALKAVTIGQDGYTLDDILVHDAKCRDTFIHSMLIDMKDDLPVALGVIRNVEDSTYDENVEKQLQEVSAAAKIHSVDELLHSGSTWEVK
jgi:2-oxoglutarate ferredoxin oxidoreductase subunit beta